MAGVHKLSKNQVITSKFGYRKGNMKHVPYSESQILGATIENLVIMVSWHLGFGRPGLRIIPPSPQIYRMTQNMQCFF